MDCRHAGLYAIIDLVQKADGTHLANALQQGSADGHLRGGDHKTDHFLKPVSLTLAGQFCKRS